MFIEAIALSMIVALLRRGDIRRIGHLNLRNTWLMFAPGVCIALLYTKYIPGMAFVGKLSSAAHILAYFLVLIVVWTNRRLPGMLLIGAGAALNFIVITANGGQMPVSPTAAERVGLRDVLEHRNNVRHASIDRNTRLRPLSDVIAIPSVTKRPRLPLPAVISVGDVVLSVGLFVLIQQAACPRKRRDDELAADMSPG